MKRKSTEVNKNTSKRLTEFLKSESLTQKSLAGMIGVTPQHLNKVVNGRLPLTEELAAKIVKYFPKWRWQYLTGVDNFKTESEYKESALAKFLDFQTHLKIPAFVSMCLAAGLSPAKLPRNDGTQYQIINDYAVGNVKVTHEEILELMDSVIAHFKVDVARLMAGKPEMNGDVNKRFYAETNSSHVLIVVSSDDPNTAVSFDVSGVDDAAALDCSNVMGMSSAEMRSALPDHAFDFRRDDPIFEKIIEL